MWSSHHTVEDGNDNTESQTFLMFRHEYYDIMTLVVVISYNLLPNPERKSKVYAKRQKKSVSLLHSMG